MSWAAMNERLVNWANRDLPEGEREVLIRLRHTLANSAAGAVLSALSLVGAHSAGAVALLCDAPALTGAAVKGMQVTVGAVLYTVTASARAAGRQITLSISPPLAAGAADNAAVTIAQPYGDTTWASARVAAAAEESESGEGQAVVSGLRLRLAIGDNQGVRIPVGAVALYRGQTLRVERAELLGAGQDAAWRVDLGEGRS